MARLGDLGCKLSVVGPLFFLGILSAKGDHAPGETGQVPHLVVQDPPSPLGDVGEPPRRDIHQVGLYCLGARWESGREEGRGRAQRREGRGRKVNILEMQQAHSQFEPSIPDKQGLLTLAGGGPGWGWRGFLPLTQLRPAACWGREGGLGTRQLAIPG